MNKSKETTDWLADTDGEAEGRTNTKFLFENTTGVPSSVEKLLKGGETDGVQIDLEDDYLGD